MSLLDSPCAASSATSRSRSLNGSIPSLRASAGRDDPLRHRAPEGGDSRARRDRAPLIALRGEAVGEISSGLRGEHERARRDEALDRGVELRRRRWLATPIA